MIDHLWLNSESKKSKLKSIHQSVSLSCDIAFFELFHLTPLTSRSARGSSNTGSMLCCCAPCCQSNKSKRNWQITVITPLLDWSAAEKMRDREKGHDWVDMIPLQMSLWSDVQREHQLPVKVKKHSRGRLRMYEMAKPTNKRWIPVRTLGLCCVISRLGRCLVEPGGEEKLGDPGAEGQNWRPKWFVCNESICGRD